MISFLAIDLSDPLFQKRKGKKKNWNKIKIAVRKAKSDAVVKNGKIHLTISRSAATEKNPTYRLLISVELNSN